MCPARSAPAQASRIASHPSCLGFSLAHRSILVALCSESAKIRVGTRAGSGEGWRFGSLACSC